MKRLFVICLFTLAAMAARSQGGFSNVGKLTLEDYLALELPPLDTLLANARKSPIVEYQHVLTDVERYALKSTKRTWLKYFKLNTNYQYGMGNDNILYNETQMPTYSRYTGKQQNWYNVGASVSFPLDEIFDRRNRIRQQESKLLAAQIEEERWFDDQSLKIIEAYTAAIQNLSILKIKAEAVTLANAQYEISKTDFINGKLDAQELSRQKNIQSSALTDYENSRAALNTSLLKLEVLSRTRIIERPNTAPKR